MLRAQILQKTEAGLATKKYIDKGELVPDDIMVNLILNEIHSLGHVSWLLDGFPRTVPQAISFHKVEPVNIVINLNIPFDVIIDRIKGRWLHLPSGRVYHTEFNPPKTPGIDDVTGEPLIQRDDDKPETVRQRLETYKRQTEPVLEYYKNSGLLREFKGKYTNEIWPKVRELLSTQMTPIASVDYK
ncbi:AK3 [Acanthosepion pharaonis]|uniref:AK3 n=1 Tax=Acanthosepion pharaonis TaxID=158019 RepID=A0A812ASS8_ACAPH|nr:AK3 [Sepia pharaonis]